MDAKHTPGPWCVEDDTFLVWGACQLGDDGTPDFFGIPVARAETSHEWERHYGYQRRPGETDANARLIAAAPELLEALCRLMRPATEAIAQTAEEMEADFAFARAAIAKAKGEA